MRNTVCDIRCIASILWFDVLPFVPIQYYWQMGNIVWLNKNSSKRIQSLLPNKYFPLGEQKREDNIKIHSMR